MAGPADNLWAWMDEEALFRGNDLRGRMDEDGLFQAKIFGGGWMKAPFLGAMI